jgi:hypothetical protein
MDAGCVLRGFWVGLTTSGGGSALFDGDGGGWCLTKIRSKVGVSAECLLI